MASENRIVSMNMTNFFNRELMMYALGDIRFSKPISMKAVGYTLAFLVVWTLPLILIAGIPTNPVALLVYLGIPIGLGQLAIKPYFGGKTMIDFVKTAMGYLGEPKGWADMKPFDSNPKRQTFSTEHEIWISRRREYALLAQLLREEEAAASVGEKRSKKARSK